MTDILKLIRELKREGLLHPYYIDCAYSVIYAYERDIKHLERRGDYERIKRIKGYINELKQEIN